MDILQRHNMKATLDRVEDFRMTLKEIVDVQNGKKRADYEDEVPSLNREMSKGPNR